MGQEFKVSLPKLGESIHSATIVQWFKKVGEYIKKDEPLLEVSTDKVNSEIPSPTSGYIKEIFAQPDQELNVGDLLALISTEESKAEAVSVSTMKKAAISSESQKDMSSFYSPAILRLAHEKGISMHELEKISGTGEGGRITRKDVEGYLEKKEQPQKICPAAKKVVLDTDIEQIKMTGMRKAIADSMVRSFYEAPHATLVTEVDITRATQFIQQEKERFLEQHGAKLTITSCIAQALAKAIKEYPLINSSLDKDTIIVKRYVNLGIAVSVDQGILVPVIKQCQNLSLPALAKQIQELSGKARSGKLAPDDVQEGTITLTNFGMSGVLIGIPIIRYPEVAIIGVGASHRKVVVLDDDTMGIRTMVHLSLTFDHRVLDGMYGCGFLAAVKKHLEEGHFS